ncbi:sugar kinase [Flexivirga endophytica]|uniref:Sugar kinase n=1 Tax=Flexivirga endophytica TaxID=1849103 RepID=A0A916WZ82_9MICO|nr:sugar kinase [Flexivirga endophytica]GHB49353.1 sugar kinase [Flexivirga endophytica]
MATGASSVSRPEQIRRHNLSVVLRHVHLHGAVSRPDLARSTGLNRSTIGALVGDLVDLGMVTQRTPERHRDGAGRPPYLVVPCSDAVHVIAVDIDVARVQVAAVGLSGAVLGRVEWRASGRDRSAVSVADRVAAASRDLTAATGGTRVGIGVSLPAMIDNPRGIAVYAPNLQWSYEPVGDLLRERLGDHVVVGNDADLAALAEHRRGVAVGYTDVVYVLGRVGVGGGVIIGGELLRGSRGYAGEIGHMSVQANGPVCHCGNRGCLEEYVGEAAILRAAGAAGIVSPEMDTLFDRAEAGDEVATEVVASIGQWLGRGLSNISHVLNPAAIVAGGHLADVLRLAEPSLRIGLQRGMVTIGRAPITLLQGQIREAPLVGAAELAYEQLLAAPDLVTSFVHNDAADPALGG